MDIVLIGSGNTATVLGRKSLQAGHRILQVYSPNIHHAELLAFRLSANATSEKSSIFRKADLTIIAIKDDSLRAFLQDFGISEGMLVHTAGSMPAEILRNSSREYGVLYPLQSLRKEIERLPILSFLIDGNSPDSGRILNFFAHTIGEHVEYADDRTRLKYHLAATMANNFSNYLFKLVESFCKQEHLSFSALQPLIAETVERMKTISPSLTQTGAAIRNDHTTIKKHEALLNGYPEILSFYKKFTDEIMQQREQFTTDL